MYSKESNFSKALISKLTSCGMQCIRLESHSTENGIPDIFCQGRGNDMWLELKNDNTQSITQDKWKVAWRPGQQAWYENYYYYHQHSKRVLTLMSCKDGIIIIHNDKIYDNNIVDRAYCFSYNEIKGLNLGRLLLFIANIKPYATYRDTLVNNIDKTFKSLDWDPDVIWDSDIDLDDVTDEQELMNNICKCYLNLGVD